METPPSPSRTPTGALDAARAGFGPLFRENPAFLMLWLGQVFSQTADKLVFILLVSIIGELTPSSTIMSLSLALHASPSVLLGAPAGVLVDRFDKKRVMVATNVLRALFVVALGLGGHQSVALAVGLAFAVACAAQPFIPAEGAAMPLVVKQGHLLAANSLFATTMIGSIIVAFVLGEPLVQWLGTQVASYVVGGGFLVSVAFLALVRYQVPDVHDREHEPFWTQLKSGLAYAFRQRPVRQVLWQQVALFGMFAAMSVLAIVFAKQELHTNFSWFLAAAGGGMGVGSYVLGHFGAGWNKHRVVLAGFFGTALALGALAGWGATHVGLAFALAGILGLTASWVAIPLQTRLQELTPEALRGKVFGAQNMTLNIATTLPLALAGLAADAIGIRTVIGVVAGWMLLVGALSAWRVSWER